MTVNIGPALDINIETQPQIFEDGVEAGFGTGSPASIFWETADANANYWAFEFPTGGGVDVPVAIFGVGIDGVDLGQFNGVTQPTAGVMDADRDSFLVMEFSGDEAARLRASGSAVDPTLSIVADGQLTLNGGTLHTTRSIVFDNGRAVTAGDYEIGRDADGTNQLHLNMPTGATLEVSINDVPQLVMSPTAINFVVAGSGATRVVNIDNSSGDDNSDIRVVIGSSSIGGDAQLGFNAGNGSGANTWCMGQRHLDTGFYIVASNDLADGNIVLSADQSENVKIHAALEIDGDLNHDGSNVGFYGIAPVARSAGWTITNDSADRAFDADSTSVAELADIVATLITDLAATGIIGASA